MLVRFKIKYGFGEYVMFAFLPSLLTSTILTHAIDSIPFPSMIGKSPTCSRLAIKSPTPTRELSKSNAFRTFSFRPEMCEMNRHNDGTKPWTAPCGEMFFGGTLRSKRWSYSMLQQRFTRDSLLLQRRKKTAKEPLEPSVSGQYSAHQR